MYMQRIFKATCWRMCTCASSMLLRHAPARDLSHACVSHVLLSTCRVCSVSRVLLSTCRVCSVSRVLLSTCRVCSVSHVLLSTCRVCTVLAHARNLPVHAWPCVCFTVCCAHDGIVHAQHARNLDVCMCAPCQLRSAAADAKAWRGCGGACTSE